MVNRLYEEQRILYAASLRRRLLYSDSRGRVFRKKPLTPQCAKEMFQLASDRMPMKIMRMVAAISSKSMFESVWKSAPPLKLAPQTPRTNFRRDSVPLRNMSRGTWCSSAKRENSLSHVFTRISPVSLLSFVSLIISQENHSNTQRSNAHSNVT